MYKLLIADDEMWIRRGLKGAINWKDEDINVAGEAEDGEEALEKAKEIMPDIMLVDINMPHLNGLELIKKLKSIDENCLIIIITGYDEFMYMHEAIKLKVFDYLLKPVRKENLREVISKAVEEIRKMKENRVHDDMNNEKIEENIDLLRQNFFAKWMSEDIDYSDLMNEFKFLKIDMKQNMGMIVVKYTHRFDTGMSDRKWDSRLLNFTITNMVNDILKEFTPVYTFTDNDNDIVAISSVSNISKWILAGRDIEDKIHSCLHFYAASKQEKIKNGIIGIKDTYREIMEDINKTVSYKPVVFLAVKYIDNNYFMNDLNLDKVSEKFNTTPSYLSKLLKQEIGLSFIEYLTSVRIKNAISIMDDPTIKIYQVAELVGYSSQHYFCRAFKKVTGLSPNEYREGV